ncbi:hypothetical protein GCM10022255_031100 [Dactylosporangium darangshiense]|uniref:Uncharacterized protein n=1 Tax=Dactylosporangium darangshiense TaxID=579108 RepID=A0ABP8D720_9ACTN
MRLDARPCRAGRGERDGPVRAMDRAAALRQPIGSRRAGITESALARQDALQVAAVDGGAAARVDLALP